MAQVVCKFCGQQNTNIASLTGGSCAKNPEGRHHVPFRGSASGNRFTCMYCGQQNTNIASLTGGSCGKNPSSKKFHVPHG